MTKKIIAALTLSLVTLSSIGSMMLSSTQSFTKADQPSSFSCCDVTFGESPNTTFGTWGTQNPSSGYTAVSTYSTLNGLDDDDITIDFLGKNSDESHVGYFSKGYAIKLGCISSGENPGNPDELAKFEIRLSGYTCDKVIIYAVCEYPFEGNPNSDLYVNGSYQTIKDGFYGSSTKDFSPYTYEFEDKIDTITIQSKRSITHISKIVFRVY